MGGVTPASILKTSKNSSSNIPEYLRRNSRFTAIYG